jgi:hypothetical protein
LSDQPGPFSSGLQLFGDDTTFDGGSGTEIIRNVAGDITVDFIGASGYGFFSGFVTADGGITTGNNLNAQLAPSTSGGGYNNLTFNGNNYDTTRLGLMGAAGDPNLYLDVPSGGQFDFRIGSTSNTVQIDANGVTTPALIGPAFAPSGSCSTSGVWVFSQDGHATFCASGTWVTKI